MKTSERDRGQSMVDERELYKSHKVHDEVNLVNGVESWESNAKT